MSPGELLFPEQELCLQAGAIGAPLVPGHGCAASHSPQQPLSSQILVPVRQGFAESTTHVWQVFQNVRHGSIKKRTGMLLLRIVTIGAGKNGRK